MLATRRRPLERNGWADRGPGPTRNADGGVEPRPLTLNRDRVSEVRRCRNPLEPAPRRRSRRRCRRSLVRRAGPGPRDLDGLPAWPSGFGDRCCGCLTYPGRLNAPLGYIETTQLRIATSAALPATRRDLISLLAAERVARMSSFLGPETRRTSGETSYPH